MHRAHDRVFVVSESRGQIEEALAREKELLATTLASIGDAVIVTNPEGRANPRQGWSNIRSRLLRTSEYVFPGPKTSSGLT